MVKPVFVPNISLGNIVTAGSMLLAVVGAWFGLRADVSAQKEHQAKLELRQDADDVRWNSLAADRGRWEAQIALILASMARLEAKLDSIGRRGGQQ